MGNTSLHDVPETTATAVRSLSDGTQLYYQLTVLQQPQRARACGMGAKSHADRRPVDPPPVVELKIFAGPDKTDVTFSHNSNFFLFTTLEQARPIAQGRGMPAPAPAPVLTGVPVSGMAYLDRPNPAGYFIFPDLSVRHEGKYRLRFSLYEESKDPEEMAQPAHPEEPREFAAHRVEVKSKPFVVFSAKKFPGLAESTHLSRMVAEQGCRVRIRRDVRMRRRGERTGRDGDSEMDETAQLRVQRSGATPDPYDHDMRGHNHHQQQQRPQAPPQPAHHGIPQAHHMQRSDSTDRKRSGSDASIVSMPDASLAPRYDDRYAPRQEHGHYPPPPPAPSGHSHHHLSFGGQAAPSHPVPPPNVPPPQTYNAQPMPPRYSAPPPLPQHSNPSPHLAPAPRPQAAQGSQYGAPAPPYHRDTSIGGMMQQPSHHRRPSEPQEYQPPALHSRREPESSYRPQHTSQHYRPEASPGPTSQYHSQPSYPAPAPYQAPPPPSQQYHSSGPSQQPAPPTLPSLASQTSKAPGLRLPPLALDSRRWESRSNSDSSAPLGPPSTALPSPSAYAPPSTHGQHLQVVPPPPPPPPSSTYHQPQYPPYSASSYVPLGALSKPVSRPPPPPPSVNEPPRGTKREWGRVFDQSHVSEPLHNGKRPDTISESSSYGEDAQDEDDDDFDLGKLKMTYRRAGGEEIVRRLPLE